jgi:endogenous inhibitor of DNA gyrase (YacG/DUF329 family)
MYLLHIRDPERERECNKCDLGEWVAEDKRGIEKGERVDLGGRWQ